MAAGAVAEGEGDVGGVAGALLADGGQVELRGEKGRREERV